MKTTVCILAILAAFCVPLTHAEVGETDVIDAIATKPGGTRAIMLLHQARPWDAESLAMLQRKLSYYSKVISSGSLPTQRPELTGKSFRIIVVYVHTPSPEALEILGKDMGEMEARGVSLKWGTQRQVVELAETP